MQSNVKNMPRERVSITLPIECIEWINEKTKNRIYANRSHAIEVLVLEAMKREKSLALEPEKTGNWF